MGVIGGLEKADAVIDYDVSEQWICDCLRTRTGIVESTVLPQNTCSVLFLTFQSLFLTFV